jgi:hypothetical protein
MRSVVVATLVAALSSALSCAASEPAVPSLQELGRVSLGFNAAASGPYAIADFDHDGVDDIVLSGLAGPDTLLQVYGRRGPYLSKQMLVVPGYQVARVIARVQGGHPHLFAIMADGNAYEFAGWPLQRVRSFYLGMDISAAAIGDVDNDGNDELVASGAWSGGLKVFDLATLAPRWSDPGVQGPDILLAQLDADPALEIVVAGTPGVIVDGATYATEWTYKDGFGEYLAPYAGGSGTRQFLASRAWNAMGVFQGQPYSPLWDVSVFNVGAIATYDFDGDGKDEIIEGDAQWGSVNVYDGQTHELTLSIPHDSYSSSAVGAVDLDGNGVKTIAYSPGDSDAANVFALYDATNGAMKWSIALGPSNPYAGASVASAGASAPLRFLFGATTDRYGAGSGWAQIDGLGGTPIWRSASDDTMLPTGPVASISLGGAGSGFVVAGVRSYNSAIVAVDDSTHAVRWQIDGESGHPLEDRSVVAMAAVPRAAGTIDTGVACIQQSGGARLFTFGLADGHPGWESVLMNGQCRGVTAGDFGAGSRLLVAVLDSALRAYDASTHLLAWSLPITVDGATVLDGISGREFATFHGTQLAFHDASTRSILRQFDLGAPIEAVQELGNIHALVVAAGGRLLIIDGADGDVRATSDFLGSDLASGNQLATQAIGGKWFIGAVSSAGAFRYLVAIDALFANGFDG